MTGGLSEAIASVHEIGPLVASRAAEAERLGQLTDDVVDALHTTGLLRINLPTELGGGGFTLAEGNEVSRALSAYDASTGWVQTILSDGPLFGRFLERGAFEEMVAGPRDTAVGSVNPTTARAEPVPGGYRFTGTATYASGSLHASWLMSGAWVHRDGQPSFTAAGPELLIGMMPMGEATIQDTWHVTGMRATASHDCTFAEVFVPEERTFLFPEPVPRYDVGTHGAIPLMLQLGFGTAATVVGAARGAQSWFLDLCASKRPTGSFAVLGERAHAQMAVGEAEGLILAAEDTLAAGVAQVWAQGERREPFDDADRVAIRMRGVTATRLALRAVDLLHESAGMNGIAAATPLERAWRDIHTATQHVIMSIGRIEICGRVLLGLDPQAPVI